mmetsp:Transcript_33938/g.72472  ORF Transcript_33938/g.72472 Transcript_33938/m.72472 type:complete len:253 (-) Transcript_33938:335-1093(-)|eukprot:CAMPEP_0183350862 /NCGR_PEP_ID=MMETSP0164_2-20130417/21447_1 /TAXON_ID=221442 /ORGANISM="Coccolithus pelagicus ssp braarudi, Strain PLY182g" /LENGTH=252 /DNA_ID=CAMNT_0025522877 /DNA_START=88 /DNA_END=846 /DNA_ORIENTATION=+
MHALMLLNLASLVRGITITPRTALLDLIAPLDRGFRASREQKKAVTAAIDVLAVSASGQFRSVPDISGDWELIYTDAPDILGLDAQAGPFLTCTRIGQQISETDRTIANVIEYEPREWATSLVGQAKGDRLQQRVITSFARRATDPLKVDLKIKGAAFLPKQILGISLQSLPPIKLEGGLQPPFGSFEVLYCEGPEGPPMDVALAEPELEAVCELEDLGKYGRCASIRIIRTQQGYFSVNRRMAGGDGWGEC